MLNGIIIVYKEAGFTSNDVVAKMRGICRQKKIGHTGTLDPAATGVLPLCLGTGTKLCDMLTDKDKEYVAELLLGTSTDTQDTTGTILEKKPVTVSHEEVTSAVLSFLGEYDQIPPMYSALKVGGKKLYELAREGKEIERKARRVEILELEILEIKLPVVKMRVVCTKGTYIRTLCADIGEKLGCGGTMQFLERTRVGRFGKENAHTLSELESIRDGAGLESVLLPTESAFNELGRVCTLPEMDKLLKNGNPIGVTGTRLEGKPFDKVRMKTEEPYGMQGHSEENGKRGLPDGERVRMCDSEGVFLGLYEYDARARIFKPVKMFL